MTSRRRRTLRECGTLVLLLGARDIAWGAADRRRARLAGGRLHARHDRVRHRADGAPLPRRRARPPGHRHRRPRAQPAAARAGRQGRADDPYIAGVRVGQNQPRVVRLVIDLKQAIAPRAVRAGAGRRLPAPPRLRPVSDRRSATRCSTLIRDKERPSSTAAKAVQDALGEFIGRVGAAGAAAPTPIATRRRRRHDRARHAGAAVLGSAPPARSPMPVRAAARPARAAAQTAQAKIDRLVVVALDPGHGGEDPGAIGPSGAAREGRRARDRAAAARPPRTRCRTCARC